MRVLLVFLAEILMNHCVLTALLEYSLYIYIETKDLYMRGPTLASNDGRRYSGKTGDSGHHHHPCVSFLSAKLLHNVHAQYEPRDLHEAHEKKVEVEVTTHVTRVECHTVISDTNRHPGEKRET